MESFSGDSKGLDENTEAMCRTMSDQPYPSSVQLLKEIALKHFDLPGLT